MYFAVRNAENVVLDTVKMSEDYDNEVVVRVYEAYGGHAKGHLYSCIPFTQAYLSNVMEDRLKQLKITDNSVELNLSPFEMQTLILVW